MAVSFLKHEVSDLCIGKPPARSVPVTATVGEALTNLRSSGHHWAAVWSPSDDGSCTGKVGVVDILCFLCSGVGGPHLEDLSTALRSPLHALVPRDSAARVRRVGLRVSILEALDLIIDGAQELLVPIRAHSRKKSPADAAQFCCLTQEDFVRFFLNYIGLLSPVTDLSVDSLGIVCTDVLVVGYHDPALSAVPLIERAAREQTAVAVVEDGKLVGEISPTTIALCCGGDESVAAAIAVLSVGELMAYIDCGGPPEDAVKLVKARLREKGLKGMLELMEKDENESNSIIFSSSSSSSNSSSSSSSDEESAPTETAKRRSVVAARRRFSRSSSYSARMSRRSEEAIVCQPGSSLMAVMMQALAHRVSYVWVVKDDDYELTGIVAFPELLKLFRDLLQ